VRSDSTNESKLEQVIQQIGDVYDRMRMCTVRLTSNVFNGTGAILAANISQGRGYMFVVTAAHNLRVNVDGLSGSSARSFWGGDKEAWNADVLGRYREDMAEAFKEGITLHYAAADMSKQTPTAVNATTTLAKVLAPSFTYDVAVLYARFDETKRPRVAAYDSWGELQGAVDLLTTLQQQGGHDYNWRLLQAGYGQTSKENVDSGGNLAFKFSKLKGQDGGRPKAFYDETAGTNEDVLVLESTAEWTTLPGDSGGPLFAVNTTTKKMCLLGVTLGSDVFATQVEEQHALGVNDADGAYNNAVTSLSRLYAAWLDPGRSNMLTPVMKDDFTF